MRQASLVIALIAAPIAAQTPVINDYVVSGVRVIHKPVTANDVIAVRVYLKGGSAALTRSTQGIESMIAQTMTRGTRKYSKDAFSALATSTGTQVSGNAGRDFTTFSVLGVRQNWNDAWDLFAQAVLHTTFPEDEVKQVREQTVNDLKQREDDPDSYLSELSDSVLTRGHPYAMDPAGTPGTVAKLQRGDLVAWHQRRLTKANLLIVVVGNVDRDDITRKIDRAFGSLPSTGGSAQRLPSLPSGKATATLIERALPTNYIQGAFPAPGRGSPDYAAMRLAGRVLGERLFEEVRTKRNLTYAVAAGYVPGALGVGTLYVTAVDPDTTLKVMRTEVRRIQKELVPAQLLRETVNVYATAYLMGQQTNMGQAEQLGQWELTGGGWKNALGFVDKMRMVKPTDLRRVTTKYMKNLKFVMIGDPKKVTPSLLVSF